MKIKVLGTEAACGTSTTNGSNFGSSTAVRLVNSGGTDRLVSIENSSNTTELIVNCPIPGGSSLELIDGGSKIILKSGDKLKAKSDTASSLKTVVSFIDSIST